MKNMIKRLLIQSERYASKFHQVEEEYNRLKEEFDAYDEQHQEAKSAFWKYLGPLSFIILIGLTVFESALMKNFIMLQLNGLPFADVLAFIAASSFTFMAITSGEYIKEFIDTTIVEGRLNKRILINGSGAILFAYIYIIHVQPVIFDVETSDINVKSFAILGKFLAVLEVMFGAFFLKKMMDKYRMNKLLRKMNKKSKLLTKYAQKVHETFRKYRHAIEEWNEYYPENSMEVVGNIYIQRAIEYYNGIENTTQSNISHNETTTNNNAEGNNISEDEAEEVIDDFAETNEDEEYTF